MKPRGYSEQQPVTLINPTTGLKDEFLIAAVTKRGLMLRYQNPDAPKRKIVNHCTCGKITPEGAIWESGEVHKFDGTPCYIK